MNRAVPFGGGALRGASDALGEVLRLLADDVGFADSQSIFRHGDPGDALFAVMEGAVEISVLSADGRKLVLNLLGPGKVFGEIALFDAGPRTASAVAVGTVRLARVRRAGVLARVAQDAGFAAELLALAGARLRWISDRYEDLAFLPLPARLARRLLYLSVQAGTPVLEMSQADLADHVGATREAVSKCLAGWRTDGLVKLGRGWVELATPDRLGELADGVF